MLSPIKISIWCWFSSILQPNMVFFWLSVFSYTYSCMFFQYIHSCFLSFTYMSCIKQGNNLSRTHTNILFLVCPIYPINWAYQRKLILRRIIHYCISMATEYNGRHCRCSNDICWMNYEWTSENCANCLLFRFWSWKSSQGTGLAVGLGREDFQSWRMTFDNWKDVAEVPFSLRI